MLINIEFIIVFAVFVNHFAILVPVWGVVYTNIYILHHEDAASRGLKEKSKASFMDFCVPAHEALVEALVHCRSYAALIDLVILMIDAEHAHCLIAEQAGDVFQFLLVTVRALVFIVLRLKIHEARRNVDKIEFVIQGHQEQICGHINFNALSSLLVLACIKTSQTHTELYEHFTQ